MHFKRMPILKFIPCCPVNIPTSLDRDFTTPHRRDSLFCHPPKLSVKFQSGYCPEKCVMIVKVKSKATKNETFLEMLRHY